MGTDSQNGNSNQPAGDSKVAWMVRGVMVGVLLVGSANALSFFFRSKGWGSLLGDLEPADEAIGFPLLVWEEGHGYGSHALKVGPFILDIGVALLVGIVIGLLAISQRAKLNQIMDRFRGSGQASPIRLQFSLRGLMITTVVAALAAAAARSFTPQVIVLKAIYALGPIMLVGFAFLPRGFSWQQRVAILVPATVVLIAVAIAVGHALQVPFDKVLMGIFICWTPQSALAALALSTAILLREYRVISS